MNRAVWLIAASFLSLAACAGIGVGAENKTDVRVIDLDIGAAPIGWIDNETILLREYSGEKVRRKDGSQRGVFRLVAYNYRNHARRIYGQADTQLCYAGGYVSYINEDYRTGEILAVYGELGKETVQKIKPGELTFDRRSCRPWSERPPIPQWAAGKTDVFLLWPNLGVISCNVRSYSVHTRAIKASYHKYGDEIGVELPFGCFDVRRGFQYYAFKGAYFTPEHDLVSPWPVGRDRKAYWLFPDGKVETIVLPYSTAIRENMVPTARGIVAFGRPAKRGEDYGVYLVNAEGTKQILPGHAAGVTSPDGCKVAILHDPEYNARLDRRPTTTRVTLKVLELCEGK